jgi:hypothetical protein
MFPSASKKVSGKTIEVLPNEILLEIFQKCRPTDFCSVLQVCKKWKFLVEKLITFNLNNFFNNRQSSKEYLMLLRCNKKFKHAKINIDDEDVVKIKQLSNFMLKNLNFLANVEIKFGFSGDCKISFSYFKLLLESLKYVINLTMEFNKNVSLCNTYDLCGINLNNLKSIKLKFNDFESDEFLEFFLEILNANQLKIFEFNSKHHFDCKKIINNLNIKFGQVNDVKLISGSCEIHWSPNNLYLRNCLNSKLEIDNFLSERVSQLKTISIFCRGLNSKFYNYIFENSEKLNYLFISFIYCATKYIACRKTNKNVKKLQLQYFDASDENLTKLHAIFPNVEDLFFIYPENGTLLDFQWKIKDKFKKIKFIKEVNSNGGINL